MKLMTRLWVTCLAMILLPIILGIIAFGGIMTYIMDSAEENYGVSKDDYTLIAEPVGAFGNITEELFHQLCVQIKVDATVFESIDNLQKLSQVLSGKSSYIVVRKNNDLYYTDNVEEAGLILNILPEYGKQTVGSDRGYYYNDLKKLVKQADFQFTDGSMGSIFVITKVNNLVSKSLIIDMLMAIVIILIFTSFMLTRGIHKGVFTPIGQLNKAMQNIAEGNLEYSLQTDTKGEIGDLYRNYEQMRLRLKETTEEKVQNEKKNRELISNISHDLKTPITAIKGYVEGITDGVADTPEKMNKYIKTIYNKANDMDRLINELTIYSGIDNNRVPYNFHRINVSEYFRDCIEEIGFDLESKNIALNYSNFVPEDTRVIADPEQMKRVINNIVGNSMKYMDTDQGVIDIRILDEVDAIRVEIEDNGKGISQKDLSNIFDRFFRTDASRNSSKGGSGIGLSIVKKIVEDHGGYIWATSAESEGTCIHFVIRKYQEAEEDNG